MSLVPTLAPETYAAQVFPRLTPADYRDLAARATAQAVAYREAAAEAFDAAQAADNPEDRSRWLDLNAHDLYGASVAEQRAARHTAEADRLAARTA